MRTVWMVEKEPTGRYRSFQSRGWPMMVVKRSGAPLMRIVCKDYYTPARARGEQEHGELFISVADYSVEDQAFVWRKMKKTAKTLPEAKEMAQKILVEYPHLFVGASDA